MLLIRQEEKWKESGQRESAEKKEQQVTEMQSLQYAEMTDRFGKGRCCTDLKRCETRWSKTKSR